MQGGNYGLDSAIRDVGDNIAQNISRYHAMPPLRKARFRAGAGAGLVIFVAYIAIGRPGYAFASWLTFAILAAAFGLGLLWLYVGVAGAHAPRDVMSAVWSIIAVMVLGMLAFVGVHLLDGGDFNFFLEGLFVAGLIGSVVRLWLALRGMPTARLDEVRTQQAHGSARNATEAEAAARLGETTNPPYRHFRE